MTRFMMILLAVILVSSFAQVDAQTRLGKHGGSDSLAAVVSTNWSTNVYSLGVTTSGYLWVKNLSSTADLGIAQDGDTTGTGTYGKWFRLEPGQETPWIPVKCTVLRFKSLKSATTIPMRMNVIIP